MVAHDKPSSPKEIKTSNFDVTTKSNKMSSIHNDDTIKIKSEKQRNFIKLLIHFKLFAIFIGMILFKVDMKFFMFYTTLAFMLIFDGYYVLILCKSTNLHYFTYELVPIKGIIGYSYPKFILNKEKSKQLIGSISELSSLPGSTANYVIQTCSSYSLTGTMFFVMYKLNEYNYDYQTNMDKIISLMFMFMASFGFFLAGHWSVFESRISTIMHCIGFISVWICSTFANYMYFNRNRNTLYGTYIMISLFLIYGKIRQDYELKQFNTKSKANIFSIIEIGLELLIVIIVQIQVFIYMWASLNE